MRLRALEPEDLDALYEIENNEVEWGTGNTTVPYSRYALRDYIANNAYDIYSDKQLRQVITDEDNNFIGIVDLVNFDIRHSRAEISIIISPDYRNQTYATQAVQHVIKYAKDFLGLFQLYAIVPASNKASIALFRKVGFSNNSTLKQWIFNAGKLEDAYIYQLFLKK